MNAGLEAELTPGLQAVTVEQKKSGALGGREGKEVWTNANALAYAGTFDRLHKCFMGGGSM